ncbi:MAG: hypothetical protein E4G92_03275 [Bacteroidia bacterium]|nr:MAG: hypothetical protein E4G92_03275 [Bacteroidia bacterium]
MNLYIKIAVVLFLICAEDFPVRSQDTIPPEAGRMRSFTLTPVKSTMYAAALPGLGQIYNRKYWKLPIVYGGFGALVYSVSYNTGHYNDFINAYQDFIDKIPETDSYLDLSGFEKLDPTQYDPVLHPDTFNPSTEGWVKTQLLNGVEYYRKYRDLSYIGIVAWYLVTVIDANVDASLFDYDISDDLNAMLAPVTLSAIGLSPGITFKLVKTF